MTRSMGATTVLEIAALTPSEREREKGGDEKKMLFEKNQTHRRRHTRAAHFARENKETSNKVPMQQQSRTQ